MSTTYQISLPIIEQQTRDEWQQLKSQRRLSPTLLEAYKFWRRWAHIIDDGQLPSLLAELGEIKSMLKSGVIVTSGGVPDKDQADWEGLLNDL